MGARCLLHMRVSGGGGVGGGVASLWGFRGEPRRSAHPVAALHRAKQIMTTPRYRDF